MGSNDRNYHTQWSHRRIENLKYRIFNRKIKGLQKSHQFYWLFQSQHANMDTFRLRLQIGIHSVQNHANVHVQMYIRKYVHIYPSTHVTAQQVSYLDIYILANYTGQHMIRVGRTIAFKQLEELRSNCKMVECLSISQLCMVPVSTFSYPTPPSKSHVNPALLL